MTKDKNTFFTKYVRSANSYSVFQLQQASSAGLGDADRRACRQRSIAPAQQQDLVLRGDYGSIS